MSEAVSKFNLELGLFIKELDRYGDSVGEIDDRTVNLLWSAVSSINRLHANSKFLETAPTTDYGNDFLEQLSDVQFECRRHIMCCACHEQIPMSREDFEAHKRKQTHQDSFAQYRARIGNGTNLFPAEANSVTLAPKEKCTNSNKSDVLASPRAPTKNLTKTEIVEPNGGASVSIVPKKIDEQRRPVVLSNSVSSIATRDSIQKDGIFASIAQEMKIVGTRDEFRAINEQRIIKIFEKYVQSFDSDMSVVQFGSTTYGLGSSDTNLNIAIDMSKSKKPLAGLIDSLQRHFMKSNIQSHFGEITAINANRVLGKRLTLVDHDSNIECVILIDDGTVSKSSQVIRNFITINPICRYIICFVRAWQNVLNEISAAKGQHLFQFSTYTIAVFAIFFLQLEQTLPVIDQIQAAILNKNSVGGKKATTDNTQELQEILFKFFHTFGIKYEPANDIISAAVGKFQKRKIDRLQTVYSEQQKRLREAIEKNPANWSDCGMQIADLVDPAINVGAEISKDEAKNFRRLCQSFAAELKNNRVQLPQSNLKYTINEKPPQQLKESTVADEKARKETEAKRDNQGTSSSSKSTSALSTRPQEKIPLQKIQQKIVEMIQPDAIINELIRYNSVIESEIASRSAIANDIVKLIKTNLNRVYLSFNLFVNIDVLQYGSRVYGLADESSDLNILVNCTSCDPSSIVFPLKKVFAVDLKDIFTNFADKNDKLLITHKPSSIKCSILVAHIDAIKSTNILCDFMEQQPMCRFLVMYLQSWQKSLHKINGMYSFRFSNYIFALLVVTLFQIRKRLPAVWNSSTLNSSLQSPVRRLCLPEFDQRIVEYIWDFFVFYGEIYQHKNHVISPYVGKMHSRSLLVTNRVHLQPDEECLLASMEKDRSKWSNCAMCVQDISSISDNATFHISEDEVTAFQKWCQAFAEIIRKRQKSIAEEQQQSIPVATEAAEDSSIEKSRKSTHLVKLD